MWLEQCLSWTAEKEKGQDALGPGEGLKVGANKRHLCKVPFSLKKMGSHWQTLSRREVLFHLRGKNTMAMSVLRKNAESHGGAN